MTHPLQQLNFGFCDGLCVSQVQDQGKQVYYWGNFSWNHFY